MDIKININELRLEDADLIDLPEDREKWQALLSTVINRSAS